MRRLVAMPGSGKAASIHRASFRNSMRKSWNKMTPAAQAEALKLSFAPREQSLLNKALNP